MEALCQVFSSDTFKKRSQINKVNRSKQTLTHGNGSMGFARREFELTNAATNDRPSMFELWKKTHLSKKTGEWINERAKEIYDEAQERIESLKVVVVKLMKMKLFVIYWEKGEPTYAGVGLDRSHQLMTQDFLQIKRKNLLQ